MDARKTDADQAAMRFSFHRQTIIENVIGPLSKATQPVTPLHCSGKYPSSSSPAWNPVSAIAKQTVRQDDKLSHYGCDGQFWRFSGGDHHLVFRAEFRIMLYANEGGHIERLSQMCSSTLYVSLASKRAAVPSDRSKSCKTGGRLVIDEAEFGHLGQKHDRGCFSNARNSL